MAVRLGFRQVRGLANAHGAAIAAARGGAPYESVEEVWRRAGTPRVAIERLAEADAFSCLAENRRQGLWKVKGLGEAPLPLFAAADARERAFSPEGLEPYVALRPMTDGREVVEDYRSLQLSLRGHPLTFLCGQLDHLKIVRCSDLANVRDGRNVEVAGVILVRQRPGSAKGVLFVTIEDETGVAQGISGPTGSRCIGGRSCPHQWSRCGAACRRRARSSISSATASSIMTICCARSAAWISAWRRGAVMARRMAAVLIRAIRPGHRAAAPYPIRRSTPSPPKRSYCKSAATISIEAA